MRQYRKNPYGSSYREPHRKAVVEEGDRSPWGTIDYVDVKGEGVAFVATPSHGGVWVRKDRQAEIPTALGRKTWYEEDCEAAIPCYVFGELQHGEYNQAYFGRRIKEWFPERWEKLTGEPIPPGESHVKDKQVFELEHRDRYVVRTAFGAGQRVALYGRQSTVPAGMVGVFARRLRDGAETWRLVPEEEYDKRGRFGFVIDDTHRDWL